MFGGTAQSGALPRQPPPTPPAPQAVSGCPFILKKISKEQTLRPAADSDQPHVLRSRTDSGHSAPRAPCLFRNLPGAAALSPFTHLGKSTRSLSTMCYLRVCIKKSHNPGSIPKKLIIIFQIKEHKTTRSLHKCVFNHTHV